MKATTTTTPELFTVFTLRLANHLCDEGFVCMGTEPNKMKPWLHVYKFEKTPALQLAINRFKTSRQAELSKN